MGKAKRCGLLFAAGAIVYPLLEIAWRGHSHWTMSLAGGLCLPLLWHIQRGKRRTLRQQCILGSCLITGVEFLFGCVFNKLLHWQVWDYSHLPLNVLGQICLPFTALWFFLCIPLFSLLKKVKASA